MATQIGEKLGLKDPDAQPGRNLLRKKGVVVVFDTEEECREYGRKHPKSPYNTIGNVV